jgi:uncharacterized NAD(P)/FAD-binding protein YdhS
MFQTRDSCGRVAETSGRVAIVGAGFSGLLVALQVLRQTDCARVFLIERASDFGRGLAYGASDAAHLLNVRASNMSAFPDEPDHFLRWLRLCAGDGTDQRGFASRQTFGAYLQSLLRASVEKEGGSGRLTIVPDEAVGLQPKDRGYRLALGLGYELTVDHVVLATGHLPPHDPSTLHPSLRGSGVYIGDPWRDDAFDTIRANDNVLLLGTGLTAIDMIMRLGTRGHRGCITALSRRGLRPRQHEDLGPPPAPFAVPLRPSLTTLLRLVRERAAGEGWRSAVDGLRPSAQRLWRDASAEERRRFLRHLRPWWDVHRHRLAPAVAASIDAMCASSQVAFQRGWIDQIAPQGDGARVVWNTRGQTHSLDVARVINCTGPAGDLTKTRSPLLSSLLRDGLARPDACRLGIDVDADCRVLKADGTPSVDLLAVGPLSRGAFWEIIAVPDIRVQAMLVGERLAEHCEPSGRHVVT